MDLLVEFLEERDRRQVLSPAVLVGDPLAVLAAVVEVQHRGHRVDADSVDVVLVQPEQGVGDQEIADLVAAVVEDHACPSRVLALARIGVFVQGRAVESRRPWPSRGNGPAPSR